MLTSIEASHLRSDLPNIRPGDTVRIAHHVQEGDRKRLSTFEGLVIARKHGFGITATITVRRVVDGIGVERIFPVHSPTIQKIEVLRRSKARRAKLYYLRERAAREVRRKMKAIAAEGIVPSATRRMRKTLETPVEVKVEAEEKKE